MRLRLISLQFIIYGIVGVVSVAIDYILLFIFYDYFKLSGVSSVSIGFLGSSVCNYFLHKYYTFSDTKTSSHRRSVVKYMILITGSYFITVSLIHLFMRLGLDIYIAKFFVLMIVYCYGFLIGKYFVFARHHTLDGCNK